MVLIRYQLSDTASFNKDFLLPFKTSIEGLQHVCCVWQLTKNQPRIYAQSPNARFTRIETPPLKDFSFMQRNGEDYMTRNFMICKR